MKKIPEPDLTDAILLKPSDLNKIHFGGKHTPLGPEQLKAIAEGKPIPVGINPKQKPKPS